MAAPAGAVEAMVDEWMGEEMFDMYILRCAGCGYLFSSVGLISHCPYCGWVGMHYIEGRTDN